MRRIPRSRSVCANALVHAGGRVEDVGVAEQRCDDDGRYVGNWLDDDEFVIRRSVHRDLTQVLRTLSVG